MTHRIFATLIALTLVFGAIAPVSAAQPPEPPPPVVPAPHARTGVAPKILPNPHARPWPFSPTAAGPARPAGITALLATATSVSAGEGHTCVVSSAGGVWCWGDNTSGQLGDNTTNSSSIPVAVSGLATGVAAVAAGGYFTCARMSAGGVTCWGDNTFGQLGDGTTNGSPTPVTVGGLAGSVTALAAAGGHVCAVVGAGAVQCWGANESGQLGNATNDDSSVPVSVSSLSSGVTGVSAGGSHSCARTSAGGVRCWGDNTYGELGNSSSASSNTPVTPTGLTTGVAAVDAGGIHTCALTGTGGVLCWGNNSYGQLGDGTETDRNAPTAVSGMAAGVAGLVAGDAHSCALMGAPQAGTVRCWGDNSYGQLGDGNTTLSNTPVAASGLASGSAVLGAGGYHTCAVTTASGVRCWGANISGQLGDGTMTSRSTPVDVTSIASGSVPAAGGTHTCARTSAGGIWCWGDNTYGQLGNSTNTASSNAVLVGALASGGASVATGGYHSCAVTTAGGVQCWGSNTSGQLGNASNDDSPTPVAVSSLSSGVAAVTAGGYHTCARTTGGGVQCWGDNTYGQLGNNSTTNSNVPVNVTGLSSGVIAVAAGGYHTCAVTSGGAVMCWGNNAYGQLGYGTLVDSSTPVAVSGLSTGGAAVTTGEYHTCARTTGGGILCWGNNVYGQLGNDTTTSISTPVGVTGLASGVAAVVAGGGHTCAQLSAPVAGEIQCWGANGYGQLGDGDFLNSSTPVGVSGLASGGAALTAGANHTCARNSAGSVQCWGDNGWGQLGANPGWTPVNVAGFADVTIYDLASRRSGTGLVMSWASLGQTIGHYEIYRASRPYFAPGGIGVVDLASVPPPPYGAMAAYTDTTTFSAPPSNLFYLVQTVDLASQPFSASTRVGGFGLKMVPGAP